MTEWERKYETFNCGCAVRRGCTQHSGVRAMSDTPYSELLGEADNTIQELRKQRGEAVALKAYYREQQI